MDFSNVIENAEREVAEAEAMVEAARQDLKTARNRLAKLNALKEQYNELVVSAQ